MFLVFDPKIIMIKFWIGRYEVQYDQMIQTGRRTNRSKSASETRKNLLIEGAKVNHKQGRLNNLEFLNRIREIRFEEGEDLDAALQSDNPEHSTGENEEVDNSSHNIAAYVSRVPDLFVNVPQEMFTTSRSSTPTLTSTSGMNLF